MIEEDGKAKDKNAGERDEKAIAIGRDAGPVRIRSDEIVKAKNGGKKR